MMHVHAFENVLARGMCVGCGACAVRTDGKVSVSLGRFGMHQADATGADATTLRDAGRVCPFSDESENEDVLAAERWPELPVDERVGRWRDVWAGRIADDDRLPSSSSGGLTTWLLDALLAHGEIDGVVHVGRAPEGHFQYEVSHGREETDRRRKSRYTSVSFAEVLTSLRESDGRYAFVGVPCFVRAARLVAREDPAIRERLTLYVGLVCGHLKTRYFAESLAWQAGIPPEDLEAADFRVKVPGRPASAYAFEATRRSTGAEELLPMREALDGNWGYAAFQPQACDFCDDVFAETADVALGDAWLPEYTPDWRGTNVVVSRNERVSEILREGAALGSIHLETLTPERAAQSQGGNYRHRRDGLRVRLADDIDAGLSVPRKRVEPGRDHVEPRRVALIRQRRRMSAASLVWFEHARELGDFETYARPMRAAIAKYHRIESSLWRRLVRRLRGAARRVASLRA